MTPLVPGHLTYYPPPDTIFSCSDGSKSTTEPAPAIATICWGGKASAVAVGGKISPFAAVRNDYGRLVVGHSFGQGQFLGWYHRNHVIVH